jgi:hypothetical protein
MNTIKVTIRRRELFLFIVGSSAPRVPVGHVQVKKHLQSYRNSSEYVSQADQLYAQREDLCDCASHSFASASYYDRPR